MKKFVLTLAMALVAVVSFAYDAYVGGIYYNLNKEVKTAEVTNETGRYDAESYSGKVVIPESIIFKGIEHPVTSIGGYAFSSCSGLTSVTIPNSVTSIGWGAFQECSGLTSVTIPNSVTSIGEVAFSYCHGLTSVTIGNSVTTIGWAAFEYCSRLTSVTIGNSVTSINNNAFEGCSGLTSVTIPNSVKSIGDYAFEYCSGLTSVTIGNSVKSIGEWVFCECSGLLDVYCYAKKVPETDTDAFSGEEIEGAVLHVPTVALKKYRKAEPWKNFHNIVPLTD